MARQIIMLWVLLMGTSSIAQAKRRPSFLVLSQDYYCPECDYEQDAVVSEKLKKQAIGLVLRDFVENEYPICARPLKSRAKVSVTMPRGIRFPENNSVTRDKSDTYLKKQAQLGLSAEGIREPRLRLPSQIGVWVTCEWMNGDEEWTGSVLLFRMPWGQFVAFPQVSGTVVGGKVSSTE